MSLANFWMQGDVRCNCESCPRFGRSASIRVTVSEWTRATDLEEEVDIAARQEGWRDHRTCGQCGAELDRDAHECRQGDARRAEEVAA